MSGRSQVIRIAWGDLAPSGVPTTPQPLRAGETESSLTAKNVPRTGDADRGHYVGVTATAGPGTSMPISRSISFTESGMLAWPAMRFISAPR